MKNTLRPRIIAFAFGIFFIGADNANGRNRENRREARREYRDEVRDARQDRRNAIRSGTNRREANREFRDERRDADLSIAVKRGAVSIAAITIAAII